MSSPSWQDINDGNAHLEDRIEPCDADTEYCQFFYGGKCNSTPETHAYPMQRPNGMCKRSYAVWNDGYVPPVVEMQMTLDMEV